MSPLKIVIADDHAAVRRSLRLLMECESDLEVVAEASNGPETIRAVQNLQPDLLILDIKMPEMTGLEVLQYLRNEKHSLAIIILSNHREQFYVAAALRLGADAFVAKSAGLDVLLEAIRILRQKMPLCLPEHAVQNAGQDSTRSGHLHIETMADFQEARRKWFEAG